MILTEMKTTGFKTGFTGRSPLSENTTGEDEGKKFVNTFTADP